MCSDLRGCSWRTSTLHPKLNTPVPLRCRKRGHSGQEVGPDPTWGGTPPSAEAAAPRELLGTAGGRWAEEPAWQRREPSGQDSRAHQGKGLLKGTKAALSPVLTPLGFLVSGSRAFVCLRTKQREERWSSEVSGNCYAPGNGVQTLKGSSFGEDSSFCRAAVSPPVTPDGLAVQSLSRV